MLSWYPLEIALPLLVLVGIILLIRGRNKGIWQKNAGGLLIFLAMLQLLFIPNIFYRLISAYTTNIAQTSSSPPLPELTPPSYFYPPDTVFSAALAAADRLKHFELISSDAATQELTLTVSVPAWQGWPSGLTFAKDDMTVTVVQSRAGSQLDLRSASGDDFADFGRNRRHITQFADAVRIELRDVLR